MSDWKAIEAAPKECGLTRILVCGHPHTGPRCPINMAYWAKGASKKPQWWVTRGKRLRYEPTHWHPLPPPPTP